MTDLSLSLELRDAAFELCRADFGAFAVRAFEELEGKPLLHGVHIDIITGFLMRVEQGEERRGIISIPPRCLKTFLASICFPAWVLGRNPRARFICCSYGADLAETFSADTLRLMKSEWYRQLFPGTVLSPHKQNKGEFQTTAGGYRYATSVGGTMTGRGADYIIVDDPLKAHDAHSPTARDNSIAWFNSSVASRLNNPKKGAIIVVSQRLHMQDLSGHLLEAGGWTSIRIPAVQDVTDIFHIRPGLTLGSLSPGRVLHPDRMDLDYLGQRKKEMGEQDFNAQYLQAPLPPGGATFKESWIKRYAEPPSKAKVQYVFQSWDTAYEGDENHSYSVCTTWAYCADGYYLLDVWRGHPQFWELEKQVYALRKHWKAHIVIVEKAASGTSLIQNIRNRDGRLWLDFLSPAGSKVSRAQQQTPKFEQGRIWLPESAPWLAAYEAELFQFPHAKHDDQVDSTVQFLTALDGSLLNKAQAFGHTE